MQHFQLVVASCCTWWQQNNSGVAGPTRFGCGSRWAGKPGAICCKTRSVLVYFSLYCNVGFQRFKSCILLVWPFASVFTFSKFIVFIVCVSMFAAAVHGCLAGGRLRLLVVMSFFLARNDAHVLLVAQVCTRRRTICSCSRALIRGSVS